MQKHLPSLKNSCNYLHYKEHGPFSKCNRKIIKQKSEIHFCDTPNDLITSFIPIKYPFKKQNNFPLKKHVCLTWKLILTQFTTLGLKSQDYVYWSGGADRRGWPLVMGPLLNDCCCWLWLAIARIRPWAPWIDMKVPNTSTVTSSPWLLGSSGSFTIAPVTRWSSRTFLPPLPIIRPTTSFGTRSEVLSRTSSLPAKPSALSFSKTK